MKLTRRAARADDDDNLIPLINVVLLMLIFFLVVGKIVPPEAFQVAPPASRSEAEVDPEAVRVLIDADSRVALGGEPIPLDQLAERLAQRLAARTPPPTVTIKADGNITTAQLRPVVDALRRAGAEKSTLITARKGP